jgi:hypothetical protein
MRRLRIPLLVTSLLLFVFAFATYLGKANGGTGIVSIFPWLKPAPEAVPPSPSERPETCEPSRSKAYAERLRYEAFEHLGKREYEYALTRLDQARGYDPGADRDVPELREARLELRRHLGLDDPSPTPGSDPNATPSPKGTP